MALFGTDYQSAYMNEDNQFNINNQPHIMQQHNDIPASPTHDKLSTEQDNLQINLNPQMNNNANNGQNIYEQNNFINDMNNDSTMDQISILKHELQKQKEIHMKMNYENESLIDKFLSKKKDVMKLVNLSLTILLGISIHYVVVDYVREYIKSSDLTENKEFFIKISYPMTIFILLWTLKVFNK